MAVFTTDAEHEQMRDAVRDFAQNEIAPVAEEHDEESKFPHDVHGKAADLDLIAPDYPMELGGLDTDYLTTTIVHEELNRVDPGIGLAVTSVKFGTEMIRKYGTDEQREWIPKVLDADAIGGTAITEPNHGSNVAGMETTAEKDGDGYVIDGTKSLITNATVADYLVVMAKTSPEDGRKGITAFLVETDTDGFVVESKLEKMGIHASPTAEIRLDDAWVPEDAVIGEVDQGFYQLVDQIDESRVYTAANAVGIAQGALDRAVEYANDREQFDRQIKDFQMIQHLIAEMDVETESARSLVYRAAAQLDEGEDAIRMASLGKLKAGLAAEKVASDAVEIHGGWGYLKGYDVERFYRDQRIYQLFEGTNEVQKTTIAKELLD